MCYIMDETTVEVLHRDLRSVTETFRRCVCTHTHTHPAYSNKHEAAGTEALHQCAASMLLVRCVSECHMTTDTSYRKRSELDM